MPGSVTKRSGGADYGNPFVGPVNYPVAIRVDVSALSNTLVDSRGYLKPGAVLRIDGTPVGGAGQTAYGAVIEATKVAAGNATADLNAADDIDISVAVIALLNRDIVEDNLGRALSADELAAIGAAGSRLAITPT